MTVRIERVKRFLRAAATLCNRDYPQYQEVRDTLSRATGLSPENVEWAFENAFEVHPASWDLEALCRRTPECGRAHVILSANVFVGALRAIAIAIAAAPEVHVRASRREPQMLEWLARVAPGQFELAGELTPSAGDHVWAYGSDETLRELRTKLAANTVVHGHGHGYGIVVLVEDELRRATSLRAIADAIASDTTAFDQRGCLSPRIVLVQAELPMARELAQALAAALATRENVIPRGQLSDDERAEIVRFRDTLCVAGEVFPAGCGCVSFELQPLAWFLPPVGRVLHVKPTGNAIEAARAESAQLTTIGVADPTSDYAARVRRAFPGARLAAIGHMQRPRLDGPVDLRHAPRLD